MGAEIKANPINLLISIVFGFSIKAGKIVLKSLIFIWCKSAYSGTCPVNC